MENEAPVLQALSIFGHEYPLISVFVHQNWQRDFQLLPKDNLSLAAFINQVHK